MTSAALKPGFASIAAFISAATSALLNPAGNTIPLIASLMSVAVATPFKALLIEVFTLSSVASPLVPVEIAVAICASVIPGFAVM